MVASQAPFVARLAAAGFASVFALTVGAAVADAQTSTRQSTTTSTMSQQRMAPSATAGGSSTAGSAQQGSGDQMSRTATGAASGATSPRPQPGGSLAASPANLGTQPGVTAPTNSRPGQGVYAPQTTPADRIGTGTQQVGPAGGPPATAGSRAQGSGGLVSPTAAGPASVQTAPGAVSGTPSGSMPATAMGGSVPGSAAPAPGGNKDAYLTYHRAIESVRLCEGRSFTQDQAEAMSGVIDRAAGTAAFGAGNMLMMIRQARDEAFRLVEVEGCQGPQIMASRQLYAKELAPVVR